MNPQQSQQLILEFVAQYHQQKRLAPTVGEIIRGSGVNSYDDVSRAIDALIQRGLVTYVPGAGGAGFTTRQVRLTGGQAAAAAGGRTSPAATSRQSAAPKGAQGSAPKGAPATQRSSPPNARSAPPPASTWSSPPPPPGHHNQQPMPSVAAGAAGVSAAASTSGQSQSANWSVPQPVSDMVRQPPVLLAVLFGGLAIGLLGATSRELPGLSAGPQLQAGPLSIPWMVLVAPILAAGLGVAVGRGQAHGHGWTGRDLARAVLLSILGGLIALTWSWFGGQLSPLDKTGIPALLEGLRILPALMAAAWVPLPGAATLGLVIAQVIDFTGRVTGAPALALLQIIVAAAPAELWLMRQGTDRGRRTLAMAGVLIGLGSTAAVYLTAPGILPVDAWPAEIISRIIAGGAAGWALAWLRERRDGARASAGSSQPGSPRGSRQGSQSP
jgi:ABC-type thiamin/hydroxymethylpyrimidine transport system permease subunit